MLDYEKALWLVSSEGAILVDPERQIVSVNPAAERFLGEPCRRLKGRDLADCVHPLDPLVLSALRDPKLPRTGTLQIGQRSYRWRTSPVLTGGDRPSALLVLADVGQIEQVEQELAEAKKLERTLLTVLDSAYEGIIIVDQDGYITLFNQAYSDFLGLKLEDVIGRRVEEVIENTRMHVVVKTGRAEIRQVQRIKGHDMICDRIPIREGDRIIGAVGKVLFRDVSEVDELLVQTRRLQQELEYYKGELRTQLQARYSLENVIGQSQAITDLREMVRRMARSSSTVLLLGESGTGKELIAHAIHNASTRYRGPFVKVNCAAIPEPLLESELFGYEEGAFTGAARGGKIGKFEQADGGTLLLDEIGDMPLSMQVKLLRVLQEREVERIGGSRSIPINVRIVAASNHDLEALVSEGKFRQDLFYRLNVVSMEIPPLRERPEDIPLLIESLLTKLGNALGCGFVRVSDAARELLVQYSWPGNVRELENVLERALNVVDGEEILPRHLPYYMYEDRARGAATTSLKDAVAKTEREALQQALAAAGGNHVEAARILALSRSALYEKMARHGIR
ncbi:MAG TPA: sigma 54-interacting transcriptional regulator [Chloroflexota bacterium]